MNENPAQPNSSDCDSDAEMGSVPNPAGSEAARGEGAVVGEFPEPAVESEGRFVWAGIGVTASAVAFRPTETFERFVWGGGARSALLFATVLGGPAAALGYAAEMALEGRVSELSPTVFFMVVCLVPCVYVLLRAVCVHTVLAFQGTIERPFQATLRAIAYSDGSVALLCLIPFAGPFLFLLIGTVIETSALRVAHRLRPGQAIFAVLAPSLILCLTLIARLSLHWIVSR